VQGLLGFPPGSVGLDGCALHPRGSAGCGGGGDGVPGGSGGGVEVEAGEPRVLSTAQLRARGKVWYLWATDEGRGVETRA
jgi:hypothetical protein